MHRCMPHCAACMHRCMCNQGEIHVAQPCQSRGSRCCFPRAWTRLICCALAGLRHARVWHSETLGPHRFFSTKRAQSWRALSNALCSRSSARHRRSSSLQVMVTRDPPRSRLRASKLPGLCGLPGPAAMIRVASHLKRKSSSSGPSSGQLGQSSSWAGRGLVSGSLPSGGVSNGSRPACMLQAQSHYSIR